MTASPPEATIALSNASLGNLPEGVSGVTYDRSGLTAGIVHIGVGNFHRAHQAWYLHRLMGQGLAHDWAILGAGVRPGDEVMRKKLAAQDYLTTLIELSPNRSGAEVTGSMTGFVPVEEGNGPLIAALSDPSIRIVSLTVTEGGYYQSAEAPGLDIGHEDIRHDAGNPDHPRTAFGAIVAALARRRAAGAGPFTVLSCDNLQGNGGITRQAILGLADLIDADLARWIAEAVSFPNSMVDCIVPATGPAEIALAESFGIADAAPVTHESFRQWVIEDDFCAGRPPLEKVGATFTNDVHSYEAMKIRVLNAGHQLLVNAGELLAVPTIADCMAHPQISAFFHKAQSTEILPHVGAVPDRTPAQYLDLIKVRFANPRIHDTTRRVAFDGSSRHAGFLVPTIRDAVETGRDYSGLALAEALWARMCAGTREDGSEIEANDPFWEDLVESAHAARRDPAQWLRRVPAYGALADHAGFAAEFGKWLTLIWQQGTTGALRRYLEG